MTNSKRLPTIWLNASLCIVFCCFFALSATGQSPKIEKDQLDGLLKSMSYRGRILKTRADSLDYQIFHTRYCLNKFRQEQYVAFGIELSGGLVIALAEVFAGQEPHNWYNGTSVQMKMEADLRYYHAVQDRDQEIRNYRLMGGGIMVAGGILHLASYRWLRKAYIQPTKEGIGIVVNF